MSQLSNTEAALALFAFMTLSSVASAVWITFSAAAAGFPIGKIQIGTFFPFALKKGPPQINLGILPLGGFVALKDDPAEIKRSMSLTFRFITGFGQLIVPVIFCLLLLGINGSLSALSEVAASYFKEAFHPLSKGPEVLKAFWLHLRNEPLMALASSAITLSFINSLYHVTEIIRCFDRGKNNSGGPWFWISLYPIFLLFPWLVALVKSLF